MSWGWDEIKVPLTASVAIMVCCDWKRRVMSWSHGVLQCLVNEIRSHQNARTLREFLLDMRRVHTHRKNLPSRTASYAYTATTASRVSKILTLKAALNFFFAFYCVLICLLMCNVLLFLLWCLSLLHVSAQPIKPNVSFWTLEESLHWIGCTKEPVASMSAIEAPIYQGQNKVEMLSTFCKINSK